MGLFDNPGTPPADVDIDEELTGQEDGGAEDSQGEGEENRQPGEQAGSDGSENENENDDEGQEQLILGKFKSQEDLARAYQEAQQRLGQMGNELGQLRQQAQPQNTQGQQEDVAEEPEWTEQDWQNYDAQFYQSFAESPGKAVFGLVSDVVQQSLAPIVDYLQGQEQESAVEQAVEDELTLLLTATDETGQPLFPGCEEMADDIDNFLDEHPEFIEAIIQQGIRRTNGEMQDGDYGFLNIMYQAVKNSTTTQLGEQAYKRGLQQGAQQVQTKNKAGLPKAGAKGNSSAPSPEDEIVNGIMSFSKGGMFGQ